MKGIYPTNYQLYTDAGENPVEGAVTEEAQVCLHVNGHELATVMCTPIDLDELALGFLRAEGIIGGLDDVEVLTVSAHDTCVDIWLRKDVSFEPPTRRVITSGCGGGLTFADLRVQQQPLNSDMTIAPDQLTARMRDVFQASGLYKVTQGIHTSALSDGAGLVLVAEDIGRHNTVDRLWGKALKQNLDTAGLILLATGRISSEMLMKAARMGVPIVASRTSPTSLSVSLGRAWNITVIGYARRNTFRVYSASQRIRAEIPMTQPTKLAEPVTKPMASRNS
jgi:FdhD protein